MRKCVRSWGFCDFFKAFCDPISVVSSVRTISTTTTVAATEKKKRKKTYIAKIIINGILGFFLMQYNLKKKLVILENYAI